MNIYQMSLSDYSALYDCFRYPAGEWQVRFKECELTELAGAKKVWITARITDSDGVMKLALLADAVSQCTQADCRHILALPYLPYGRADRRFTPGDCCGLRAFGHVIDTMGFHEVRTLDAHAPAAAEAYIKGLINVPSLPFIYKAIQNFSDGGRVNVLFPDDGAAERYAIEPAPMVNEAYCTKDRDLKTGKLLGFNVPKIADIPTIIVDDICDAGGTFLGIAKTLRSQGFTSKLGLYVTHGIYSKGIGELHAAFDRLYTTDTIESYWTSEEVLVYPAQAVIFKGNCDGRTERAGAHQERASASS